MVCLMGNHFSAFQLIPAELDARQGIAMGIAMLSYLDAGCSCIIFVLLLFFLFFMHVQDGQGRSSSSVGDNDLW